MKGNNTGRYRHIGLLQSALIQALLISLFFSTTVLGQAARPSHNLNSLQETVSELTAHGDRATASPGNSATGEYIRQRLHAAAPAEEGVIDFTLPLRRHHGSTLTIDGKTLALSPLFYNAVTPQNIPESGISGELVYVGKGELHDFNGLDIEGSIVLMDFDSGRNWLNAASLGAAALIYVDSPGGSRAQFLKKTELSPIQFPCFHVSGHELAVFLGVTKKLVPSSIAARAVLTSKISWEKATACNYYALFPGTDEKKKDELLIVEAFYDASSLIPGTAPGADESLSIAALLELGDHLRQNPPQRPFLLIATNGHAQQLAGMREFIWSVNVSSKDLRRMAKELKTDRRQRKSYLKALEQFLAGDMDDIDGMIFQAAVHETLKLEIDHLSTELIALRMSDEKRSGEEQLKQLTSQRLHLRRISWQTDYANLSETELSALIPITEKALRMHRKVLAEIKEQERMLKKNKKLRSLLTEYEPRAVISLHLSSHGSGLGAFERGFALPLRDRINRTGAFREIDRILRNVAEGLEKPTPQFISTLRPDRLHPWQDMLPDKPHLGGEISCLAGLPGFTLATFGDLRSSWGTPSDLPENIDWQNASMQWELTRSLIMGLDDADALPLGYIRNGFSTVSGKAGLLLHGELFAEQPAPGTLLLAFQGPARYHLLTDLRGGFLLKGVADKKHVQDKVIIEGYKFSTTDGGVDWAIDKKLTGKSSYRIKMRRQNMRTDLVMFNCEQTTLFNLLEPRSLNYMTKIQLIDGRREAPPLRYWYSRIDTRSSIIASIFLEPGTRLKLTLSDTILKKKMILSNSNQENPLGKGYETDTHPSLYHTNYLAARDTWALLAPRIRNLEDHGIHNDRIKALQYTGLAALDTASTALAEKQYTLFSEASNESWALASRVYHHVESTQKDVLFGVLFYIALFVPFAFCMERLLCGYVSIYKRIIAFTVILALQIALIAQVHPAFELAYSPTVVILAFFIIGLSFLVTMIIVLRFENEMALLQRRASHKRATEISTWKAFMAAFYLGVSNLRRRRLRTALTCLTLIILTFTIMSFTTVSSIRRQNKLNFNDQATYQGILLKNISWKALPDETLSTFQSLFNGNVLTGPRVWLSSDDQTRPGRLQVAVNGSPFMFQGLTGLSPHEPDVSGIDSILLQGRWFRPDEPHSVIIPSSLAARINIDPDRTNQPTINLWGVPLKVAGVFSPKKLQRFTDLDGELLTPVIFPSESSREISEVEKEALESGEDIQSFQGRYRHLAADQILILPAKTLLTLGGSLQSVALRPPSQINDDMLSTLTDRFNLTLFCGEEDGTYVINAGDAMSYSGMPNIIIPLVISILIVLNTMISSVYERKREIAVYTSVGLAPTHVSFLFIAEALAFGVISVVLGYLLAQTSAGLLAGTALWKGITVNYSSTAGVAAMVMVMVVVLLSVIYPSRVAAKIAIPDVNATWVMPDTTNDSITVTLPFLMRYHEHPSICGFLYAYLKAHQDVSHGVFSTGPIEALDRLGMDHLGRSRLPMADECLHLRAKVWLAPFDFGIMQWIDLQFCHAREGEDFLEISVTMTRRSGESGVWKRVNTAFIHTLRKQLLVWRSLSREAHDQYAAMLPSATSGTGEMQ